MLEAVRKLPAGRGVSKEAEIDSEFDLDGNKAGDGETEGLAWPSSGAKSGGDGCNSSGGGGGGGGCCHHHPVPGPADDDGGGGGGESAAKEGAAVLEGFRRLLWFWSELLLLWLLLLFIGDLEFLAGGHGSEGNPMQCTLEGR